MGQNKVIGSFAETHWLVIRNYRNVRLTYFPNQKQQWTTTKPITKPSSLELNLPSEPKADREQLYMYKTTKRLQTTQKTQMLSSKADDWKSFKISLQFKWMHRQTGVQTQRDWQTNTVENITYLHANGKKGSPRCKKMFCHAHIAFRISKIN